MEEGATAVHLENVDVLVIVSGLSFETDLTFLRQRKLNFGVNVNNKLVYEAHWYAFADPPEKWIFSTNEFCAEITEWFMSQTGYVIYERSPTPIFLSEFGKDQNGASEAENRYFICVMALLADKDLEWALWAMQGSYYLREGQVEWEEPYGMYSFAWDKIRNSSILQLMELNQQMIQGIYYETICTCLLFVDETDFVCNIQILRRSMHHTTQCTIHKQGDAFL